MRDAPLLDLIERKKAAWAGAEEGAERAADHAERVDPGWNDAALVFVERFARWRPYATFMMADVREYAEGCGLLPPPDPRAWGAVALAAKRAGLIVSEGYGNTSLGAGHTHPCALWRLA